MILLKAIQCCYLYEVWNLCTQVIDRWLSKICRRTEKCSYIFFHSRTSLRKETSIKVIHTPQEHYEDSFHCLFIEIDAVHRKLIIDYGVISILCDIFATHYIRIHIFANTSTTDGEQRAPHINYRNANEQKFCHILYNAYRWRCHWHKINAICMNASENNAFHDVNRIDYKHSAFIAKFSLYIRKAITYSETAIHPNRRTYIR